MKLPAEAEILAYLKKHQTSKRTGHTMAVAHLAEKLARKHGLSPARARLAGLLHDAAKNWTGKKLAAYAKKHRLRVPDIEATCRRHPGLLHAYVGAHIARAVFGVKDAGVLSAIAKHSLGSVHMSRLEKCLYVADLASPDRKFSEAGTIRDLAMRDLNRAFARGMRVKFWSVLMEGRWIHPESVRVWNRWAAQ